MNKKFLTVVFAVLMVSTAFSLSANIDSLPDRKQTGEDLEISGDVQGEELDSYIIQYKNPDELGWNDLESNNCASSCHFDFQATQLEQGTVKYQILAVSDTGDMEDSDVEAVEWRDNEYDEESVDYVSMEDLPSEKTAGEEVSISGTAEGKGLDQVIIQSKDPDELGWNDRYTHNCGSNEKEECSISRDVTEDAAGDKQYQIYAEAAEDEMGVSDHQTVEWTAERQFGIDQEGLSLSVDNDTVQQGNSTTARVSVSNTGDTDQHVMVEFLYSDEELGDREGDVPGDGSRTFTMEVSPESDGYVRADVSTEGDACGDKEFDRLNEEITVTSSGEEGDEPPIADFTYTPQNPVVDEEVEFDAGPSTDDKGITSYMWDFGTADENAGRTVTRAFEDEGSYPVTLTVEDSSGQTDSHLRYVTVGEPEQACGVSSRDIQLSLEDYIIERGDSTNADVRIFNTGDQNQDVRVRLEEGNSVVEDTTVTVPAFGSQTVTRSVSPDRDTYIRADVSTEGEPCGDRSFPRKNREIAVISGETEEASLDVRVEDDRGAPLRNAEVSVDGPEDLTRFTDSSGDTAFTVEPGQYDVEVSHPDYETREKSVRLYEDDYKELEFTMGGLEGEGRFKARVKDGEGDWIEDARVRVENGEYEVERTDSYGRADFRLESDRYDVRVSHPDYESVDRASVEIERGETVYRTFRLYEEERARGLTVASTDYPDTVCRGDTLPVDVRIRNDAERDEYVTVTGKGLGSIMILDSFVLEEDESAERTVRFTDVEGSGRETFRIQARNGTRDEVTRSVEVKSCDYTAPPDETISRPESISMKLSYPVAPNKAIVGDTVKVSGFVDGVNRRSEVEVNVDGERKARVSTQPDGYYQTFITVDEVGTKTVTARAEGVSASREIQVLPSAFTGVLETPRKVFEGETFQACTQVTSPVEAKVVLLEDGTPIKSTNANGEVCFDVKAQQPGEHVYEVRALTSGTDSSSKSTVNVLKSDVQVKSFPGQVASVESGSGMIKIDLYNTHEEPTRYNLELEGLPETWTSQTRKQVVLTKGEERTVHFYLTPREEGDYRPELKVEADNQMIYNEEVPLETGGRKEPRQQGFFSALAGLFPF